MGANRAEHSADCHPPDGTVEPREARLDILGVEVDNLTFDEAIARIIGLSRGSEPTYVVTPNVDHVMRLRKDPAFRAAYAGAALTLTDGMPLVWASRVLGDRVKEKVSGSDLVPRLTAAAAEHGRRVYYLGGREGAVAECARVLKERHPALIVAGTSCPPVGFHVDPEKNRAVIEEVRRAKPDILFVALGTPKQEYWLHEHHEALGVPVSLGIGASIDFIAGHARRAPKWMQRAGLEWLHRLGSEPRRLWRRYLLQDSPFVWLVAKGACARMFGRGPSSRGGASRDHAAHRATRNENERDR